MAGYNNDLFGDVSAADTGERSEFDFYETPAWMTRSLLRHHPLRGQRVWEPCAGRLAIVRVLEREGGCAAVWANDKDRRHHLCNTHFDATSPVYWATTPKPDYVVTNVAFNVAYPILQLAVEHAVRGVAMLLRKTFDEPTRERGEWLAAHPWTRSIKLPRYSFRGSGSDTVACDWFLWEKAPFRDPLLPPVVIDYLADVRRP